MNREGWKVKRYLSEVCDAFDAGRLMHARGLLRECIDKYFSEHEVKE